MNDNLEMSRIRAVKDKHEKRLLRKRNVVGVGIGYRERNGERTEEVVLTVMVRRKLDRARMRPWDRIPSVLDGVPVDVQEVGELKAL